MIAGRRGACGASIGSEPSMPSGYNTTYRPAPSPLDAVARELIGLGFAADAVPMVDVSMWNTTCAVTPEPGDVVATARGVAGAETTPGVALVPLPPPPQPVRPSAIAHAAAARVGRRLFIADQTLCAFAA